MKASFDSMHSCTSGSVDEMNISDLFDNHPLGLVK